MPAESWEAEAHFSQLVLHLREQRGMHVKNLVKSADADIERAIRDPKRYGPKLEKGDLVLMEQSKMGSRTPGTATKLFMQTTGPHRILRKMPGADIFEIELGDSKLRRKVPGERLRKLPPTVEDPYPHRLQWVLEGTSDESGWKVIAHHNWAQSVKRNPRANGASRKDQRKSNDSKSQKGTRKSKPEATANGARGTLKIIEDTRSETTHNEGLPISTHKGNHPVFPAKGHSRATPVGGAVLAAWEAACPNYLATRVAPGVPALTAQVLVGEVAAQQ
eukprot:Stramenopile-MAST_4_protein_5892